MIRQLVLLAAICLTKTLSTDTNYRLNTPIKPESYEITITPYFNTGNARAFTFDGEVTIRFRTESVTNQIKLHSQDLTYNSSDVTLSTGNQNMLLNAAMPLEFNTTYSFLYINLQTNLQIGVDYVLKVNYIGQIREDLNGFYRNYYIEKGVKKWLGATQMEPTHARKVFPCFDEPDLKATFTLTIDRPANFQPSLANTKLQNTEILSNGMVREKFYPTPKMSTYLVAFLVSEFDAARYTINGDREFGVFARPEAKNQSDYAFDFGSRVVDALGAYFGINYYSTDANLKLDHIALPDFRAGAMENWGLIKYREALLLYVPDQSTPYFKYRVAQIVAHETTHMWFGNLVTCHWWSNTWLNEGFANYFQDYITSLIEPDVGAGDQLVIGSVYSAYDADDSPDAPPISNVNVNSPAEISAHFGTITYQKAGSVIRMMHHLLGNDSFILGLNLYLSVNEFGSGYPELMYAALDESANITNALAAYSGAKVADVMGSWISQAGHPVINVQIDFETETVTLTQRRFYIEGTQRSNETYKIPITYTTGISPNFQDTKPAFIMENPTHVFKIANLNHSWVIFNVQETGLYRVNYDDHAWEHIVDALKGSSRSEIHYLNRAKIINDVFALYYADEVSFSRLRDVLDLMELETEYAVCNAAIRGLNKLRNSFLGTDSLSVINSYIVKVTNSIINKIGYEPKPSEGTVALRNRMQVLDLACKAGHSGCIENAVKLFENFKDNNVEISPSLRPVAYCYGLRKGELDGYEFLWRRFATTNVANEAYVIGDVLGCTSDLEKLKKYLYAMGEEESPIRIQDLTVPLTSVLSNYDNVDLVLDEMTENFDRWTKIYDTMETVFTKIASALHTDEEFNEFESWLSSCDKCSADAVTSAKKALTEAKASSTWAKAHQADIVNNLKNRAFVVSSSFSVILIGFITVMCKTY